MAEEKLLTVREVSLMLGLSEKEVLDLAENGSIPAYKLGGLYLRFKRQQVEEYWKKSKKALAKSQKYSLKDRIFDFYSFNDFYIFSMIIILLMLYIIFKGG
jgi:excisionase family DNA binding protein